MFKGISYITSNVIRKTPNKVLLIFFFWIAYSFIYIKFTIMKQYYQFKIKGERENKRTLIFKLSHLI